MTLSRAVVEAWAHACVDTLAAARQEINALNVFPVADHDTGTNAYATLAAATEALDREPEGSSLPDLVAVFGDTLLRQAKGNCGVILSQLIRAALGHIGDVEHPTGRHIAEAFTTAADTAYTAVGAPVEGTILTVARAAADAAQGADSDDVAATIRAAHMAAREALAKTPEQLEQLQQAGVVDAGGRALVAILEAAEYVAAGPSGLHYGGETQQVPQPAVSAPVPAAEPAPDSEPGGPAYEVMYLLNATDTDVDTLKGRLNELGDSVVVVGGDGLWNVHVHVDDPGAAIEAGIDAGRPHRIAVTHFADQIARQAQERPRAVLTATTGAGLACLARQAGGVALEFSRGQELSADAVAEALRACNAGEVIALANNARFIAPFEHAARTLRAEGITVAVIPTTAQVQGLSALAVHDPAQPFEDDVVAMSSAAAHTRHGGLTIAAEAGITSAGPCQAGDVLGVVAGDFAVVGDDPFAVSTQVLGHLISPTAELLTLVVGHGAEPDLAERIRAHVTRLRPEVDTVVYDGDQENYLMFFAVE